MSIVASDNGSAGSNLELAVLWRGAPGWFDQGSGHQTGGGGSGSTLHSQIRYGNISLAFTFNRETRVAGIQGTDLKLGDANLVLVDNVDGHEGPHVVRAFRVDPAMPGGVFDIGPALRSSPEALSFLRCGEGIKMPNILAQFLVDKTCVEIVGK